MNYDSTWASELWKLKKLLINQNFHVLIFFLKSQPKHGINQVLYFIFDVFRYIYMEKHH